MKKNQKETKANSEKDKGVNLELRKKKKMK